MKPRSVAVITHKLPEQTAEAVGRVIEVAAAAGIEVQLTTDEVAKHGLDGRAGCVVRGSGAPDPEPDLALVLGGDGTILGALRDYAGTKTPVFAVNYGAIGFLSTVDRDELDDGLRRALEGRYELLSMPALAVDLGAGPKLGINDISFHRRANGRVAELEYTVSGEQLGDVRCDGLVAATPVGSTGYNLANGGPVLAWGVEGFVVSFIAPHTLTARALVVAPADTLRVLNLSQRDAVDVSTDGRAVGVVEPRAYADITFLHDQVLLAQLPGATFYHRLREKFGRLAY